jgi:hypothetical protein
MDAVTYTQGRDPFGPAESLDGVYGLTNCEIELITHKIFFCVSNYPLTQTLIEEGTFYASCSVSFIQLLIQTLKNKYEI